MQGCLLIRSYFLEITVNDMSKEELIAKYSSRNYNRKEMKAEVSNYVDEFDKENTKYY